MPTKTPKPSEPAEDKERKLREYAQRRVKESEEHKKNATENTIKKMVTQMNSMPNMITFDSKEKIATDTLMTTLNINHNNRVRRRNVAIARLDEADDYISVKAYSQDIDDGPRRQSIRKV
ncbi:hypothetical protein B7494_g7848 [Chlorociboria aeruginascens]|nr:hypothetical protein B7494_g7848 [Chlorociboria aeruginascens]